MSYTKTKGKIHVNRNLRIGLVLGVLQFIVYFSGYDYVLRLGPFVAHHFLELPAFFFIGWGFSEFFSDLRCSSTVAQFLNVLIFLSNIAVSAYGQGLSGKIAAFKVSFPEIIGFYYHRIILLRTNMQK